jgi:hypothetical protein
MPAFTDAIWKQDESSTFKEYDELLLEYLEKLGFISKPRQQSDEIGVSNMFFVWFSFTAHKHILGHMAPKFNR